MSHAEVNGGTPTTFFLFYFLQESSVVSASTEQSCPLFGRHALRLSTLRRRKLPLLPPPSFVPPGPPFLCRASLSLAASNTLL